MPFHPIRTMSAAPVASETPSVRGEGAVRERGYVNGREVDAQGRQQVRHATRLVRDDVAWQRFDDALAALLAAGVSAEEILGSAWSSLATTGALERR